MIVGISLIFYATNRHSVRSVAGAHVGTDAAEGEDARIGAANRTAPVVARATDTVERTIDTLDVAAAPCQGQFKRGSKSPCCIILACPT